MISAIYLTNLVQMWCSLQVIWIQSHLWLDISNHFSQLRVVFGPGWCTKRRQNDVEAVFSHHNLHSLFLLHLLPVQTINSENLLESTHQSKQTKSHFLLILSLMPWQNQEIMNTQYFVLPSMAYLEMLTLYSYLRILIFTWYLASHGEIETITGHTFRTFQLLNLL